MPELPEIEALRLQLAPRLEGRRLRSVEVRHPRICRPGNPGQIVGRLQDLRLDHIGRRSKYLVFHWKPQPEPAMPMLIHLGMTGGLVFTTSRPEPGRHTVALLEWDHGFLAFEDPRRFGLLVCGTAPLEKLGPEPLSPEFTPEVLARVGASRQPIKVRLMDAAQVSGIGNIYASEVLHRAEISPRRRSDRIRGDEWPRIHGEILAVLREAIGRNVRVQEAGLSPYYHEAAGRGSPPPDGNPFRVYDREGRPCTRCGTPIRRCEQAGRSTYWCPGCQR